LPPANAIPVNKSETDLKTDEIDTLIIEAIRDNQFISIPNIAKIINRGITVTKGRITKLKKHRHYRTYRCRQGRVLESA